VTCFVGLGDAAKQRSRSLITAQQNQQQVNQSQEESFPHIWGARAGAVAAWDAEVYFILFYLFCFVLFSDIFFLFLGKSCWNLCYWR